MSDKVKSIAQESKDLAALMANKPQIDQMLKYYEDALLLQEQIYDTCQERIDKGYVEVKHLILGFIPVKSKKILDGLEISRLKMEMNDISNTVFNQKQYFEGWKQRKEDYEIRMDKITRECNEHFDEVLKKAKEITANPQLQQVISGYSNPDNDQEIKNQFFLYLKQNINNSEVFGKKQKMKPVKN